MNNDCLFCKIYADKDGIIYEDDYFYAQLDKFPVSAGHAEVIPKRHVISLFDLRPEEWQALYMALKKTVAVVETTDLRAFYAKQVAHPLNEKSADFCQRMLDNGTIGKKPDGYNFGNNDGEAAGRTIHHLHIHSIPRYK